MILKSRVNFRELTFEYADKCMSVGLVSYRVHKYIDTGVDPGNTDERDVDKAR